MTIRGGKASALEELTREALRAGKTVDVVRPGAVERRRPPASSIPRAVDRVIAQLFPSGYVDLVADLDVRTGGPTRRVWDELQHGILRALELMREGRVAMTHWTQAGVRLGLHGFRGARIEISAREVRFDGPAGDDEGREFSLEWEGRYGFVLRPMTAGAALEYWRAAYGPESGADARRCVSHPGCLESRDVGRDCFESSTPARLP